MTLYSVYCVSHVFYVRHLCHLCDHAYCGRPPVISTCYPRVGRGGATCHLLLGQDTTGIMVGATLC